MTTSIQTDPTIAQLARETGLEPAAPPVPVVVLDRAGVFYGRRHHEPGDRILVPRTVALTLYRTGRARAAEGRTPTAVEIRAAEAGMSVPDFERIEAAERKRLAEIDEARRPPLGNVLRVLDGDGITVMRDRRTYALGETFEATDAEAAVYFKRRRAEYADPNRRTPTPEELFLADADKNFALDPTGPGSVEGVARRVARQEIARAAAAAAAPDPASPGARKAVNRGT